MAINVAALKVEILRGGQPDRVKRDLKDVDRAGAKAGVSVRGLSTALTAVGIAFTAAAATAVVLGTKFLKLGSAALETRNKFVTTFGDSTKAVDDFLQNFNLISGLSRKVSEDLLADTAAIAQGLGFATGASADFSIEMAKVAGDIASFKDRKPADVFLALNAAITGERESLKRLGIVFYQVDVDQRALLNTGKELTSQLTQQDKATASLQLITAKAGVAIGDLERTSASTANVMKQIPAAWDDITVAVGKFMAESPFVNEVLIDVRDLFRDIATILESNAENIKSMFEELGRLAGDAFLGGFWAAIGLLGDALFKEAAKKHLEGMEISIANIAAIAKDVAADIALQQWRAARDALTGAPVQLPGVTVTGQAPGGGAAAAGTTGGIWDKSGKYTPGMAPIYKDIGDEFAAYQEERFGSIWGPMGLDKLEEVEAQLRLLATETMRMIGDMADTIELGLEQTLGDAIFNGLEAAFDTGNLKSFFEHFGKTLLAGFGDILVQLGQILIQYGITMEALRPFLTNIFTAGPAAIAAGAALIALGSAFTSITSSSSGGVGRGSATAGAFREPRYGFSQLNDDVARKTISMGTAPTIAPQQALVIQPVIIGPNDPSAQSQIVKLIQKAARRGLQVT